MTNVGNNDTPWQTKRVLVTGGASFIGSTLVDRLVERGAAVRIVDDLSSGKLGDIAEHIRQKRVEFIQKDLREPGVAREAVRDIDIIFHLAADHGGRGYIELHQAGPASNLFLDGLVFWEAVKANVEEIVFASSGCVYPNVLQDDPLKELYLTEDLVVAPYDADNMYGWAKLMAELTLRVYHTEYGIKTASLRYFTVYGPRGVENHAVMAMIARAFIKQNPYEVWGNGMQIRNWTYVDDIITGTLLAAEKIDDGTAINLGTMERIRVIDAVNEILRYMGLQPEIKFRPDMPVGPLNRVADNARAKELLGWEPKTLFLDGVHKTIDWYRSTKDAQTVKDMLDHKLTGR